MRTCFHLVGRIACLTLAILLACSFQASSADPFAEGVRTTDPRTPEAQRAGFKLPPGIEVDLIASEPNIAKPMNMAFDARGRLWVTTSYEYPFAKKPGEPARDFIRVFEDTDRDGSFEKSWIFADNLNIPIGILPYQNGCIVWSIPNIWMLRDTDGDGKADQRDVLFGPLGWERDTHGNLSSFRMGADGWVYATHGFNNTSTVKARDGSSITMNSGNTFRFRPDGSRVEQFTWGQVNPFGMCIDDYGYLYTADCHSSPIYQLIPGGYYPSFGKPDDGLGFAPVMVQHSHGSTAISGIVILPSEDWPADLQGHLLIGNVMTSRLNRDRIDWTGSSPSGVEMPDFLSTDDPWFRPVDLQLGPDGALYVADFYNRIIGHYEVPLLHPGRDRERGRIWRIRPKSLAAAKPRAADFTSMDAQQFFLELGSANALRRQHALNQLIDRVGIAASSLARQSLANPGAP
ncbi:MAG: dehydrogenase, partial [Verrucomicrobia bacterium]|nr:dehydrogenase [Verrucomicrobiota bacterium]